MNRSAFRQFAPALLLGLGAMATMGLDRQRPLPLTAPLASVIPLQIEDYEGRDIVLGEAERRAAGVDAYLLRSYSSVADTVGFSVYVGYYEQQMRGRTIHTPKNCLPGSGWEALMSQEVALETDLGTVTVNRYLLRKGDDDALVLYWYQGRGRVVANEYRVKWNLLRDAALRQRTEEALVRIVVPVTADTEASFDVASRVARTLAPALVNVLPD